MKKTKCFHGATDTVKSDVFTIKRQSIVELESHGHVTRTLTMHSWAVVLDYVPRYLAPVDSSCSGS